MTSGSEKKKSDLLEWKIEIWVLRRKKMRFWLDFSNSWSKKLKKSDFLEWKSKFEKMKSDFDFGFWEEKIRFLGVKNRNLGSLEKGNKSDFDLAFRIPGVKSWKNQISWSEKSKFEKKKSDFDLTPGVKSWIWVLRRTKRHTSWSGKSKFGFWEEEKSDFELTFRFLRVKS